MCGITGYFDLGAKAPIDRAELAAMGDRLAHRGPDDAGCFDDGRVGLAFRRLSLVDLKNGSQPVFSEDGQIVSICNGEIYDHREIRADLRRRGHRLHSECDTELLPHLYEERGIGLLDDLSGQFAFALYDRSQRRLYLARDQFGICPLYYTVVGGLFLFASEIKALLANRRVPRAVDLTALDQTLLFPGVSSPRTMFKGVHSVAPGHWLCVTADGIETREFWDLDYPRLSDTPSPRSEQYYVERVHTALINATRRRLQADLPVGCYLSGGLDSSMVMSIAASLTPDDARHSFSVSFGGTERCERRYQNAVARRARSIHHDVPMPMSEVLRRLPRAVYHAECPIKETHDTACLMLSQSARAHRVPVALTGQGADELFAGYIGYRFDEFHQQQAVPARNLSPEEIRIRERLWGDATIAYDGNYARARHDALALYSPELRSQLAEFDAVDSLAIRRDRLAGRDAVQQRSYLDLKLRLGDHLLTDHGDRMAMAHSIEVRHPFLDMEVVEAAREMPSSMKIRDGDEKYVLKQVARAYVDDAIVRREKFGWYTPGSPDMIRAEDPYVTHLLSPDTVARQGYFDAAAVERLKHQYLADGFTLNQPYESDVLTIVLTFGIFLDVFDLPAIG